MKAKGSATWSTTAAVGASAGNPTAAARSCAIPGGGGTRGTTTGGGAGAGTGAGIAERGPALLRARGEHNELKVEMAHTAM